MRACSARSRCASQPGQLAAAAAFVDALGLAGFAVVDPVAAR
jgi:hypothetical protein